MICRRAANALQFMAAALIVCESNFARTIGNLAKQFPYRYTLLFFLLFVRSLTLKKISRHSLHDGILQSHSFTTLLHSFVYKPRYNYFFETAPKAQECWHICGPNVGVSGSMGHQCGYRRAKCDPRYRHRLFLSVRLGSKSVPTLPKSSNKMP